VSAARLDHESAAWRAVPHPCPRPIEHEPGPPVHSACSARPLTSGGGRVGITTGPWGCAGCRPRLGGTPVVDETVAARCHATGCGPVPPSVMTTKKGTSRSARPGRTRDRHNWDIAVKYGRHVPVSMILGAWVAVGGGNGPQPVAWRPAGTVSSRTGVPASRGRPSERPRYSVVNPTPPPPHLRGRCERGRHARSPAHAGEAVLPESGTARPRDVFDRVPRNAMPPTFDSSRRGSRVSSGRSGRRGGRPSPVPSRGRGA
jgi:hypothetical protein